MSQKKAREVRRATPPPIKSTAAGHSRFLIGAAAVVVVTQIVGATDLAGFEQGLREALS